MNCPICNSRKLRYIYRFGDIPAMQHVPHKNRQEALNVKKVVLDLRGCEICDFVFNAKFNPKETQYSNSYDNTQDHSPFFKNYLKVLAKRLIKNYSLHNKHVVEVGCGKGHFLKILSGLEIKNLKGFDPSYVDYDEEIDPLVIKKFFNKKTLTRKVDFIICRHVLEHIARPKEFVREISQCLVDDGTLYFEFPRLEWIIKNEVFFDFFYEHCNYFSQNAVRKLFSSLGFTNINFKYGLSGQYFQLEINEKMSILKTASIPKIGFEKITRFIENKIRIHQKQLKKAGRFIVWGAGAKGVTFLNSLNINYRRSPFIIDINPSKQKNYVPITGQKIVSPEILRKEKIDNIIIMNPIYEKEIKALAAKCNYKGKFILL